MLRTETKEIDGTRYHVRQLGASKGRAMLVRLTKVLGPVLARLMEGNAARPKPSRLPPREVSEAAPEALKMDKAIRLGQIMEADATTISATLTELAVRLREEDLEYVVVEFGECTEIDVGASGEDKRVKLNSNRQELHFAGRYAAMFKWVGFCLEVNYRDFFSASETSTATGQGSEAVEP